MASPKRHAIRAARDTDLAAILALERACFVRPGEWFNRRQVARLIGNPRAQVLVIQMGKHLAGWGASLVRQSSESLSGRVYALAVHGDCRGQGLGKKLFARLVAHLRRRGCRYICLEVRSDNAGAIGLYRKLGFAEEKLLPDYYGPGLHAWKMVLPA
jgi:ribosomal-protein-alanine N-acetyltransferase